MKKILTLLFLIICLIYTYTYAETNIKTFKPKYGTLISNTNFRQGTSTNSKRYITLEKGTVLKLVAEQADFYVVQTGENTVGAVYKGNIKLSNRPPDGSKIYMNEGAKNAYVSVTAANLRKGPSKSFSKIGNLSKGAKVTILGSISDWKVVLTEKNTVGMIRYDLLDAAKQTVSTDVKPIVALGNTNERALLSLINDYRAKNGKAKLLMTKNLLDIARLKAADMVKKDYFAHVSPTYGTPFKMLNDFGVSYIAAGENLAGNSNMQKVFDSWIASPTHKENILSKNYNQIGIGVVKSEKYGYVVSALFIGK